MDTSIINTMKTVLYNNKQRSFSIKFKRADLGRIITITEDLIAITDPEIINEIQKKIDNEED